MAAAIGFALALLLIPAAAVASTAEDRAQVEAVEREHLAVIEAIDPSGLDDQDRLGWKIFRRDWIESIDALRFPDHLLPVNQMFSLPILFVQLGSPGGLQPFRTIEDFENWLGRVVEQMPEDFDTETRTRTWEGRPVAMTGRPVRFCVQPLTSSHNYYNMLTA